MSKYAWVTLATNDSYSLGALVVANSLKRVHTAHQLAVLITPGVSESMRTKLRAVFNLVDEVNLLDSKDEANLALLKRPELGITFTKLHCWRLTQYEKCVFLDADTLVLRNCDELFEREELSAAPDIGWPDCFNSGVYVFRPSLETFASLLQFAVTNGSFDGGDQGLLNAYFSDWAHKDIQKHLPFVYNTSSVATYSYLPAFKHFGQNTKILHFIGVSKPWLQNFNSETRKVYVPSECQHLANFLQYWWDIFCEDVHSRLSSDMCGLAGALAQLHLGEAKSQEQEAYQEHMRRQCWETGNIDYMGRDSFDNIWRRIQQTLTAGGAAATTATTSTGDDTTSASPPAAPVVSAAPPSRRSPRSRSTTPKRDARERSPTPQPEDKVPVEKKEAAHVVPPPAIAEEDDSALSSSVVDGSRLAQHRHPKLPPPIQYDPTTNTTTLTKKVFAGYQQIITTKSPEGKTRTHTKLVYDPSVDDEEDQAQPSQAAAKMSSGPKEEDVPDGVPRIGAGSVMPAPLKQIASVGASEPVKSRPLESVVQSKPKAAAAPPPTPASSMDQPAPAKAPAAPQQQVAQESLTGKGSSASTIDSTQPTKTVRKKRTISPPSLAKTNNITTNKPSDQSSGETLQSLQSPQSPPIRASKSSTAAAKPSGSSNRSSAATIGASSNKTATIAGQTAKPSANSTLPSRPAVAIATADSLTEARSSSSQPSPPLLPTRSVPPTAPKPQDVSTVADATKAVPTPPVPPRRKRESRTARLARLLRTFCTIL
ncbi:nucleolar and coiled-body phosphoprotein 1 isoform X6 [Anopheles cruzii]|uniref:nucleolar and coiled-body phosphoprotein 1 isoform X6 n=1 Tax=Anopheles cruzii TaxID=68878 RepID=UPI0022EC8BBA|nr:nucleolar and coiled-body phosphoprotein 1 isoform X6 [Anopheles cruzii]